ncbi:MAG: hypothetical protein JWN02_2511 [Acidobacteria bacterium]|nr:hypothetical protein [Acidobacteriota bacterium]
MSSLAGVSCTNHWETVEGLQNCVRCQRPFCRDCIVTIGGNAYCAQCKNEQMLDVVSGVSGLPLASIGRRFGAQFIDGLIFSIPFWGLIFMMYGNIYRNGGRNMPPSLKYFSYGLGLIFFLYEGLMLSTRGQTLGKMAVGLKVVRADGSPISQGQAWGRAAVRALLLSFAAIINYLPAFFTKEKTCVHDMAAKTRVVNWS